MTTVQLPQKLIERVPLGWAYSKMGRKIARPPHLQMISHYFYKLAHGSIKRLMIWAPSRHGKSETVSHLGLSWYFDRPEFVNNRVILTSYESDVATRWGRKVRDTIQEHGRYKLNEDVSAAGRWNLAGYDGGMLCAGARGGVTSYGANLFVIDDPHKDNREFLTGTTPEDTFEWYRSTVRDRLEPGGGICIDMQRWAYNDLCGLILENTMEEWTILSFPAIAGPVDDQWTIRVKGREFKVLGLGRAPGEPLWKERYDIPDLKAAADEMGVRWAAAKRQQDPLPRDTQDMISPLWFPEVKQLPADPERGIRYFDMATKSAKAARKQSGDYASGCFMIRDTDCRYGVIHSVRFKRTAIGVDEQIKNAVRGDFEFYKAIMIPRWEQELQLDRIKQEEYNERIKDLPLLFSDFYTLWFESDTGGMGEYAADAFVRKTVKYAGEIGIILKIKYEHPSGAKPVRADPLISTASTGSAVYVLNPPARSWEMHAWRDRIVAFPHCEEGDDDMDSMSGAYSKLVLKRDADNLGLLL